MNLPTDNSYVSPEWKLGFITLYMVVIAMLLSPADALGQSAVRRSHRNHTTPVVTATDSTSSISGRAVLPDSIPVELSIREAVVEEESILSSDTPYVVTSDSIEGLTAGEAYEADSIKRSLRNAAIMKQLSDIPEDEWVPRAVEFNPDPTRAVWLSALFPGLGQIYNRRYWKLPIIVGGYLGLGYATNWNNQMLTDYNRAYSDLLDNDPSSNSYMDFFAPNVEESDIDKSWLQNLLRSRKNFFRRNRDLCIISMVGVYLLAMVDAYVDASLSHFDITPRLSMDVVPTLMQDGRQKYPSVGLAWALNF